MPPPGTTLTPNVFFYVRKEDSPAAGGCRDVEFKAAWKSATDWDPNGNPATSRIGHVKACDFGLPDHELHRSGDNFVLVNPEKKNVLAFKAPTTAMYFRITRGKDGALQYKVFPQDVQSSADVEAFYRKERLAEVTTERIVTTEHGNRGSIVRVELDIAGAIGDPAWALGTDLEGQPLTHEGNAPFRGAGLALRLRPMFPRYGIFHWFHPLRLAPEVAFDSGSITKAYTARGDEDGSFTRWHVGGRAGLEIDSQWLVNTFTGQWKNPGKPSEVVWRIGWDVLFAGYREMNGHFAGPGAALASDVSASGFVSNEHRVYTGINWCPPKSPFCFGFDLFYAPNEGLSDHPYKDTFSRFGGTPTADIGRFTSTTSKTVTEVGDPDISVTHPDPANIVAAPPPPPPVVDAPPPPPPQPVAVALPTFKRLPLGDHAGWKEQIVVHMKTGKIDLSAEDQTKGVELLRTAQQVLAKLPAAGLGWTFKLEGIGRADTRGGVDSNDKLSMGRAHSILGKMLDLGASQKVTFLTPGAVRAVGLGEREARDIAGKIIPGVADKSRCRQGRIFTHKPTQQKVREHTCDRVKYLEPLAANRTATVTARWIPPGADSLETKDTVPETQLRVDRSLGPKIASALRKGSRGRPAFTNAVYDATSNRLFVSVTTLDKATLQKLNTHFLKVGKGLQRLNKPAAKQQRVSFPVEFVLSMDTAPDGYQKQIQDIFYDFNTFPYVGGLSVTQHATGTTLEDLQRDAASREETAADRAQALYKDRFAAGNGLYSVVPVPIADLTQLSRTQMLTLYKIVHLAQKDTAIAATPDALLTMGIVNFKEKANPKLVTLGGYALKSAARNFVGIHQGSDVRLGNTAYLIFLPNTAEAKKHTDLSNTDDPQVKALIEAIFKSAGVPLSATDHGRRPAQPLWSQEPPCLASAATPTGR